MRLAITIAIAIGAVTAVATSNPAAGLGGAAIGSAVATLFSRGANASESAR